MTLFQGVGPKLCPVMNVNQDILSFRQDIDIWMDQSDLAPEKCGPDRSLETCVGDSLPDL